MFIALSIFHGIVCLFLILVVLLQTGKRADLAGAFGGGGSQTAFGARGAATFLSKSTTIAAVVFMVTSLALALLASRPERGRGTVLDEVSQPATPVPGASPPAEPVPASPSPAPAPEQKEEAPPPPSPPDAAPQDNASPPQNPQNP